MNIKKVNCEMRNFFNSMNSSGSNNNEFVVTFEYDDDLHDFNKSNKMVSEMQEAYEAGKRIVCIDQYDNSLPLVSHTDDFSRLVFSDDSSIIRFVKINAEEFYLVYPHYSDDCNNYVVYVEQNLDEDNSNIHYTVYAHASVNELTVSDLYNAMSGNKNIYCDIIGEDFSEVICLPLIDIDYNEAAPYEGSYALSLKTIYMFGNRNYVITLTPSGTSVGVSTYTAAQKIPDDSGYIVNVEHTSSNEFIISVQQNSDGTYTCDRTAIEIQEAFTNGKQMICYDSTGGVYLPLIMSAGFDCDFLFGNEYSVIKIDAFDDTVEITEDFNRNTNYVFNIVYDSTLADGVAHYELLDVDVSAIIDLAYTMGLNVSLYDETYKQHYPFAYKETAGNGDYVFDNGNRVIRISMQSSGDYEIIEYMQIERGNHEFSIPVVPGDSSLSSATVQTISGTVIDYAILNGNHIYCNLKFSNVTDEQYYLPYVTEYTYEYTYGTRIHYVFSNGTYTVILCSDNKDGRGVVTFEYAAKASVLLGPEEGKIYLTSIDDSGALVTTGHIFSPPDPF